MTVGKMSSLLATFTIWWKLIFCWMVLVGASDSASTTTASDSFSRMSIANMTCGTFPQPLNHFVPRGRSPTYEERYCVYYDYASAPIEKSPIFFYTGNESPLEQYINQVGCRM